MAKALDSSFSSFNFRFLTSCWEYAELGGAAPLDWILKYFFLSLSTDMLDSHKNREKGCKTIIVARNLSGRAIHIKHDPTNGYLGHPLSCIRLLSPDQESCPYHPVKVFGTREEKEEI
jgi:hypothetical protein